MPLRALLTAMIVLCAAPHAGAQVPPGSDIHLSLGTVQPGGDFDDIDLARNGFSLYGSYGIYLLPRFELGCGLGHIGADAEDRVVVDEFHYNRRYAILRVELYGRWMMTSRRSSPYLHARIGAHRISERVLSRNIQTGVSIFGPLRAESTEPGYGFGGGFQIGGKDGSALFFEIDWQHIARGQDPDWDFMEARAGISISLSQASS